MKIRITYCYDCGYTDQVTSLVPKILDNHEDDIDELTLVPASDGIFDVELDGKLIYSKHKTGWFPSYEDLAPSLGGS
jgi:selenoprotein W-related protein